MSDARPPAGPEVVLEKARSLEKFIADLTLRISRERTVNYSIADYPKGGPDGMKTPGEEGKVVRILAQELRKMKVPFKTYAKVRGRDNLLASVGMKKKGYRKLMVLLHTDVVPAGTPEGWKCPAFKPHAKGGKIYGRGVLDNKGPLAACFATLRILKGLEKQIPGEFIFGAMADEEVGVGVGLPYLIKKGVIKCTDAIVPDTAGNMKEINIAEKGRTLLKVHAHGKQAHAYDPSRGVNAIHAMAHFLAALEKHAFTCAPHPYLPGGATVNTGLITGGVAPNSVPADCDATLDIRYMPGQTADGIRDEIQAIADLAAASWEVPGASFEVKVAHNALPCEVNPEASIIKMILKHAPDARIMGSGGGTFAKDLVLMGVEAVGWACGDEETYHQANEEIEIAQLVTFAGRLANLALDLCAMKA